MTNRLFVKPKAGLQVRDPQSRQLLAADGQLVEDNTFYRRRLADGDIVETTPPAEPKSDKK